MLKFDVVQHADVVQHVDNVKHVDVVQPLKIVLPKSPQPNLPSPAPSGGKPEKDHFVPNVRSNRLTLDHLRSDHLTANHFAHSLSSSSPRKVENLSFGVDRLLRKNSDEKSNFLKLFYLNTSLLQLEYKTTPTKTN